MMENRNPNRLHSGLWAVLCAFVVIAAALHAAQLRWVCDDLFITLRYADNFLHGKGLVFNGGEYVEGYSHFLWLMLIIPFQWLGLDPVSVTMGLGILCYAGILWIFCCISRRLHPGLFLPMTALVVALHYDMAVWATGGLETSLFCFLLSAAFYIYFFSAIANQRKLIFAGMVLVLAMMTRPDAALFFLLANFFLAVRFLLNRKQSVGEWALFNLGFVVFYLPYLLWKYSYYGDIFPNTYYSKAAYSSYFQQGFLYLKVYFLAYRSSLLIVPALIVALSLAAKQPEVPPAFWSLFFAVAGIVVYLILFVARVGGDFMYARFIIPVVPFIYFTAEYSIFLFLKTQPRFVLFCFLLVALSTLLEKGNRDDFLFERVDGKMVARPYSQTGGITDERWFYAGPFLPHGVTRIDLLRHVGQALQPYFNGLDAIILLRGQSCLGYYGKFKTCIEGTGLTDNYIAHLPLGDRKTMRIGHEKLAPDDYLIRRGADLLIFTQSAGTQPYKKAVFHLADGMSVPAEIITYDPSLISQLRQRCGKNFVFVDFQKYLDNYIQNQLPGKTSTEACSDYVEFRNFYFLHNKDPKREDVLKKVCRNQ